MTLVRVEVDPGNLLDREFTDLERKNLPFATMQAVNQTAFATRQRWTEVMPQVFDRPTSLTMRAVLYRKATAQSLAAEVFLRDDAFKGAPPAKYLRAQVDGGARRQKRSEVWLQRAGILPPGMFTVPGQGANLDNHGNVPGSQITAILSAMRAQQDAYQNVTAASTKRRRSRRRRRGGEYFAVRQARGKLQPGIYERIDTGFGSAVRSVLFFVKNVSYRARYEIYGLAQKIYDGEFPFHFERELEKAVQNSKFRGRG